MFKRSVILIGMPGSGKSTIGRIVAEACGMDFVDTDHLLAEEIGMSLQEYLDRFGMESFAEKERDILSGLSGSETPRIIATGGSAVLYPDAAENLKKAGTVVFLDCDLPLLRKRLWNFESRGIVIDGVKDREQAILDLYMTREPLYYKYSDIRISQSGKSKKTIVSQVIKSVEEYEAGT
ncbi:MAG: shikimate kinase [Clostridiales bacterium]|nr:shikimate kinase [Clostridiales bacterium]